MKVEAVLVARSLVIFAIFPALAGCATLADEPLQRGDLADVTPPLRALTPAWASPDLALVRPGTLIRMEDRDCLANFLFTRPDNAAVFVGTTAYCVRGLPIGSVALIGDDTDIAVLVYNSAETMAEKGERDENALEYNDLALFHLDRRTVAKANPTLPTIGGPDAMMPRVPEIGDRLRAYARADELPRETDWREGVVSGRAGDWALITYTAPTVTPGTTGGAVVDQNGAAVGVLVTLGVVPDPGANAVARIDTMLAYARDVGRIPIELALAPQP